MYEFGRAHAITKAGHLFPMLFDMGLDEFEVLFSPARNLEAISILDKGSVLRVVEQIALLAELEPGQADAIMRRAHNGIDRLQASTAAVIESINVFLDTFRGMLSYNTVIYESKTFNMPSIFGLFKENLFLVGINHNFLLNLRAGRERFEALLDGLLAEKERKVEILISNLWDIHLRETYKMILFGEAKNELEGLDEVFTNESSELFLDTFIRNYCSGDPKFYDVIRRRLSIRVIDTLMDSFWFIDVGQTEKSGDMMLLPMTIDRGINRAAFYASKRSNPEIFEKYWGVCRGGWQSYSNEIWPKRDVVICAPPTQPPGSP